MPMAVAPMCVEIPPRYCPLPTAVHPDTKLLQERGAKWLNSFGLCTQGHQRTRMLGNDCAGFYGRIMPEASTDRLQLAVDWFFLALVLDDINCDEGAASILLGPFVELAAKMLQLLEAPTATVSSEHDVFILPAQDIAHRAWQMGTPTQIRRAIDAYRAWCFGVLWEFGLRSMSTHPSVNDYAYMRQHTAGGLSTVCWTEIIDGNEIPEPELSSPAVRALTEIALTTSFLDNDLFSYGKEMWVALTDQLDTGNNLNLVEN